MINVKDLGLLGYVIHSLFVFNNRNLLTFILTYIKLVQLIWIYKIIFKVNCLTKIGTYHVIQKTHKNFADNIECKEII